MNRPVDETAPGWAETPELGNDTGLRWAAAAYQRLGRIPVQLAVWPSAFYFLAAQRTARESSLDYLRSVHAMPGGAEALATRTGLATRPGLGTAFRHFVSFGRNIADRLALWAGSDFEIRYRGDEHLRALVEAGRGGFLLGAHVGSFDMMRVLAARYDVPVNVVMFTRHAERINELFERLDPSSATRVIQIEPGALRTSFEIRACIERGEFVGILADRLGLFPGEEPLSVPLLGRQALLPRAPFRLATVLGCPVLTAICLRAADGAYDVEVAPLVSGDRLAPRDRPARIEEMARGYAQRLEDACLREPLQWFNFYPYFTSPESA